MNSVIGILPDFSRPSVRSCRALGGSPLPALGDVPWEVSPAVTCSAARVCAAVHTHRCSRAPGPAASMMTLCSQLGLFPWAQVQEMEFLCGEKNHF